jgi:hypothetical protein
LQQPPKRAVTGGSVARSTPEARQLRTSKEITHTLRNVWQNEYHGPSSNLSRITATGHRISLHDVKSFGQIKAFFEVKSSQAKASPHRLNRGHVSSDIRHINLATLLTVREHLPIKDRNCLIRNARQELWAEFPEPSNSLHFSPAQKT